MPNNIQRRDNGAYEEPDGEQLDLDIVWDGGETAPPQPRFSAGELVEHLASHAEEVTVRDLHVFSDLSRRDFEEVRRGWPLVPVERRRTVVRNLIDLAEQELSLHLGRILRIALHDSDADVRRAAVEGLWEEIDADLIGPLVDLLRRDESDEVRAGVAAALGNYVLAGELDELDAALAMRAEQALLEVLRDENEPVAVQSRALESLAYSGEVGVRQLIEDAYYSPNEELRVSALVAMGRSADVHWRNYVRAELQSPTAAMRREAARAIGELEAKSAVDELLLLLVDEDPEVRLAAIFALGRIGGRDARTALRAITEEGEPAEAQAAEEALEEMMFYADEASDVSLFDEDEDDDDEWEDERWGRSDNDDLGEYER
jgi:HEAT repeat protein